MPTFLTSFMRTHARTKKVIQVSPRKTAVVMARTLVREDMFECLDFHNPDPGGPKWMLEMERSKVPGPGGLPFVYSHIQCGAAQ
jgi:hypothetical protein